MDFIIETCEKIRVTCYNVKRIFLMLTRVTLEIRKGLFRKGFEESCFNVGDLVNPLLVASARKRSFQPGPENCLADFRTGYPATQGEKVRVVMLSGIPGHKFIVAACCLYARDFVRHNA